MLRVLKHFCLKINTCQHHLARASLQAFHPMASASPQAGRDSDWAVAGEGNANIVLLYRGDDPQLVREAHATGTGHSCHAAWDIPTWTTRLWQSSTLCPLPAECAIDPSNLTQGYHATHVMHRSWALPCAWPRTARRWLSARGLTPQTRMPSRRPSGAATCPRSASSCSASAAVGDDLWPSRAN